jgi:peptidoglycan-associated lipoprotein
MKAFELLAACLVLSVVQACGGASPQAVSPSTATPAASGRSNKETPAQAATSGSVQVSPDILKACGLSDADAYFAFDSARLERQDIVPLNAIAACLAGGALKGHEVKLVGHADPRGAPEYNMTLGQSRADGVEGYLEKRGVGKSKMETSSRGAMDATGTSDTGWSKDRRVDVLLGH